MNDNQFETQEPMPYQEAVALYHSLLAEEISDSRKMIAMGFIGGIAAFIIGWIFQALAGSHMFSLYTFTDSVILHTLASITFYLGWVGFGGGMLLGVSSIFSVRRQQREGLSQKDVQVYLDAAAKSQESDPQAANEMLEKANTLTRVLAALGR